MKTRTTVKFLMSALCVFVALFSTSFAENGGTGEYLYRIKELSEYPVAFLSDARLQSDETLADKLGIYKTTDLEMLKEFEEMGILEFYEENAVAYLFDMPSTDELKSNLYDGAVPLGNSYDQIVANELWKLGLTGREVIIGVVDSGVNKHDAIKNNLLPGKNFSMTDEEKASNPSGVYDTHDGAEHGTRVAGLIAANSDNYRGIAYEAKIVPLKSFNDAGDGNTSTMAEAVLAAVDEFNCDIINMSCGSYVNNKTLKEAVEYALSKGVSIVSASGNVQNPFTGVVGKEDPYMYPASYEGVISVGNIESNDTLWSKSHENDMVDVVAPGTNLTLLHPTQLSKYKKGTGTSFSCPVVTGVVALIKQAYPDFSNSTIESLLCFTAADLGDEGFDISYGYGKVDCEMMAYILFYNQMYISEVVEHKGTYNIAFRNGLYDFYEASAFISGYNGGKMMSVSKYDIGIPYGESYCMTFREIQPEMKMFFLDKNGLIPLAKAISFR